MDHYELHLNETYFAPKYIIIHNWEKIEGSQEEIDDQSNKSQAVSENTSGTVAIQNGSESPMPANTIHVEDKEEPGPAENGENIADADNAHHTEKEGKISCLFKQFER